MQVGVSLPDTFGLWTSDGGARFFPIRNFAGINLCRIRRALGLVIGFWVLLAVMGSSETLAQIASQKCDRCGQLTTSFVVCCELVPEVKREKKPVWSSREEYFCLENPSISFPQFLWNLSGINRSVVSQPSRKTLNGPSPCQAENPPACSSPRVRKILVREEKEEETVTWKYKPVILCPGCAQGAPVPPAQRGEKAASARSV